MGWYGDGTGLKGVAEAQVAATPGIVRDQDGRLRFSSWNCRAGQNNVIVRTDGTVGPCFPMYSATYDWGTIEAEKFAPQQLRQMRESCQQHCFSTLNHNLSYCDNDARVIKWLWQQARRGLQGGAPSFED